jgi:hypothetical protein
VFAGEPSAADYDRASDAFFALQDRYRTPKWFYADLGYSALAWAAVLSLVGAFRRGGGKALSTRRLFPVLGATALGLALLAVGLLAGPLQSIGRDQVPWWADSYGLVIFSTVATMAILTPVVAVLTLSPILLTRRRPAPLLSLGIGWLGGFVVGLVYLAPLFATALLVATVAEPGGWATSTAGGLLFWLLLNARAIWLGTSPSKALP